MDKQNLTPRQERQLRFAEAGIIFVLVLGIAVFVGVKLSGPKDEQIHPAAVATAETIVVADSVADPAPEIVAETEAETAVDVAAPQVEPEPVVVTYALAEETYFAGDYGKAADLFARYVKEHSESAWGFYMLGLSEWKAGDPESADEALVRASELNPTHVASLVNHGRVLLDLGRTDEAEACVAAAVDLDPADTGAQRVLGRVRDAQGRLDEAVACYEAVLVHEPEDAWALNNLGLILIRQERFDTALAPLAKATLLRPEVACMQNNLGIALERTGHLGAAANAYARALEADDAYAKADISRTRVAALVTEGDEDTIDLEALAAAFTVTPAVDVAPTVAEAGFED